MGITVRIVTGVLAPGSTEVGIGALKAKNLIGLKKKRGTKIINRKVTIWTQWTM